MKINYKSAILSAILPIIIAAVIDFLIIFIFGNAGKIELICNKNVDGKYQSVISLKNLKKSEYLNDVEIKIDDSIKINSISINGEKYLDKSIIINKIEPSSVSTIIILSDEKITDKDITIIKNNQNIELESFNNYSDYRIRYLVLVCIYGFINFFVVIYSEKKFDKILKEHDKLMEENKNDLNDTQQRLNKIDKYLNTSKVIFAKEISDLERENAFYEQLLLSKLDNVVSKEEFEILIEKELKTFSEKKIKHLSYEDMFDIINELSDVKIER